MRILTVLGARPQFIKAAPVSKALQAAGIDEFLVHTGQHYDHGMSQVFFDELGLPEPNVNLGIGSGSHGEQTGRMLIALEHVFEAQKPDWVLVYGDTNSTLAGALAAVKLHLRLAHVEAGLRSFNRAMPEEHNRVLADHCADRLFCPTVTAVDNLRREGITQGVQRVGDTMYDAVLQFSELARQRSSILDDLGLAPQGYLLATVHRPYNTDDPQTLAGILAALAAAPAPVIFPAHPRTAGCIRGDERLRALAQAGNLRLIPPAGYLDMLALEQHARLILTDSGGMQKEAYFFGVPCITLRPETEWIETVAAGWSTLAGSDPQRITAALNRIVALPKHNPEHAADLSKTAGLQNHTSEHAAAPPLFGNGHAAEAIAAELSRQDD